MNSCRPVAFACHGIASKLEYSSVLLEEAWVARESLWLLAKELAVLVDSEDLNIIELVSETPTFRL